MLGPDEKHMPPMSIQERLQMPGDVDGLFDLPGGL